MWVENRTGDRLVSPGGTSATDRPAERDLLSLPVGPSTLKIPTYANGVTVPASSLAFAVFSQTLPINLSTSLHSAFTSRCQNRNHAEARPWRAASPARFAGRPRARTGGAS
jgi:hypothetical protein